MDSIGGNIISTLGAGSGINSTEIVGQLRDIEKAPKQAQIDADKELFEAQISDFGLLRSALSTLQDSAKSLANTETFNSKSASFTNSDAFIPVSLEEETPVGEYSFEVIDVAQSHSLSSGASFADPTDEVGKGTLTLNFGSWDKALPPTTFTANSEKDAVTITIDDSNNSLNGLRDAINAADAGVTASIVNDGAGYKLLLTAESGENNQLSITATEDAGAPGLAAFEFNQTTQNLVQNQQGQDAQLKINGLDITRSSNVINDVLPGFEFNVSKPDPGNIVTVTITEDKAGGEQAVRDFVAAYNEFLSIIEPAVGFDEENDENGSLFRDPTARGLDTALRSVLGGTIAGLNDGFTALSNVGVRTNLDGTLEINDEFFNKAFDENYDEVKALFVPQVSSSSDKIVVNSFRPEATPGSYDIVITQDPEKGNLVGNAAAGTLLADISAARTAGNFTGAASAFASTDLSGATLGDYGFDIAVDGGSAVSIQLPPANYADENAIAAALQSEFDAQSIAADIVHNGSAFVVTSRSQGDSSAVSITAVLEQTPGEFGLAAGSATAGTGPNSNDYDFAISVDGTSSNIISLVPGSYATNEELAAHIQSQINNDSALKAGGAEVDVVWNTDHFEITSRAYGSKSTVSVLGAGPKAADLGLAGGTTTAGTDVAGTVNGVAGFGVGQVLLPELNSPAAGLSMIIEPGATTATIDFSRGFGEELNQVIDTYLETNGLFAERETTINRELEDLEDDQDRLDARSEAYYNRLLAQFLAMERIVNSLSSSGSALNDIANRLPFTAQSN